MDTSHFEGAAAEWGDTMELGVDGDADELMLVGWRVTACTEHASTPRIAAGAASQWSQPSHPTSVWGQTPVRNCAANTGGRQGCWE
jgi:hypothetical protein